MRFPRTIRFDASDSHAFEHAAAPDEWAVSGAFVFADADPAGLAGKARQAFANGFLGTASFGWSTFVAVAEIGDWVYDQVVVALTQHLMSHYGAPDLAAAETAARAEAEFASSLCEHAVNTVLCVNRRFEGQGIVEQFRAIEQRPEPVHAKIWEIVDDDG